MSNTNQVVPLGTDLITLQKSLLDLLGFGDGEKFKIFDMRISTNLEKLTVDLERQDDSDSNTLGVMITESYTLSRNSDLNRLELILQK